jgi:hypothetical protein
MDPMPMLTAGATLPQDAETGISFGVAVAALVLAAIVLFLNWRREQIARATLAQLPPPPR